MKIKRTGKAECLGVPLKEAGEVSFIGQKEMERRIERTEWGFKDMQEVDPATETPQNPQGNNRPFGHVVGMRTLRETGKIETFAAVYELIEA